MVKDKTGKSHTNSNASLGFGYTVRRFLPGLHATLTDANAGQPAKLNFN